MSPFPPPPFPSSSSIVLRSAATFAYHCNLEREAERLVGLALSGHPPDYVRDELLDLLEDVRFRRHLGLKGLELSPDDVQLSISGKEAPPGLALSEEFVGRVQTTEKLFIRGVERLNLQEFRESGKPRKELTDRFQFYLSVPRAASFAVTLRLGRPMRQLGFPQMEQPIVDRPEAVVDNVMECLASYSQGDERRLKQLIPQDSYYRNFVGLAEKLVPDGDRINVVGLTTYRNGNEFILSVAKPPQPLKVVAGDGEPVTATGRLLFASAPTSKNQKIKVFDEAGKSLVFSVPEGIMADIVKPLWENSVIATGFKKGSKTWLEHISAL